MKDQLAKCKTYHDSEKLMYETPTDILRKFHTSLLNAHEFIELTIRDYALMNQAEMILSKKNDGSFYM